MRTLLTILFIGIASLKAQVKVGHFDPMMGDTAGAKNENLVLWYHPKNHTPIQCECCSEWLKQIGLKDVLITSFKELSKQYTDSATVRAILDYNKELERERDELIKKAIDCR